MNIERRTLKRSRENEKVSDINGAQESTRSTWSSSPHSGKSLRYCGSVISAFIALPTISKKKLSPFENAPHYSLCLRGCRENSLLSAIDIVQLGVSDLLVYTVSSNITFCSKGTLWYDLFSLHMITALREYDLLCTAYDDSSWNGNVKDATLECNCVSIDAKLENLLSILLILTRN